MIYVLNGPNLNRLGTREPESTARRPIRTWSTCARTVAEDLGVNVEVEQTNAEHQMLEWLHRAADEGADVVLNPAAWTHYNFAIRDACAMLRGKLVEVHISNIHQREEFRHHSVISAVATGVIAGLGFDGYRLALEHIAR